MDQVRYNDTDLGEQYSEMLLAYYNKLSQQRRGSEKVAAEEVKLRLFLSLLDKPAERDWEGDDMRAAS
jgi:hypothetical protein